MSLSTINEYTSRNFERLLPRKLGRLGDCEFKSAMQAGHWLGSREQHCRKEFSGVKPAKEQLSWHVQTRRGQLD